MTNSEFSDAFTTLLNSYSSQAQFGEQSSQREIVLDEYEKSVLLTQAQDIIVKSYFDANSNSVGQGFDDSARRQIDFSSLIKVVELTPSTGNDITFDDRGILYELPKKTVTSNRYHTSLGTSSSSIESTEENASEEDTTETTSNEDNTASNTEGSSSSSDNSSSTTTANNAATVTQVTVTSPDVLFILNEKLIYVPTDTTQSKKDFVIIPINYKEYDREMSKPYAQPLKKQAWRLFQNNTTGFDLKTELIPRWNYKDAVANSKGTFVYKIRYVKRPKPIILESLPDDLEIDGISDESSCELNPILHMDILNKAVELAISTRGGTVSSQSQK